jgi:hypothetical protein
VVCLEHGHRKYEPLPESNLTNAGERDNRRFVQQSARRAIGRTYTRLSSWLLRFRWIYGASSAHARTLYRCILLTRIFQLKGTGEGRHHASPEIRVVLEQHHQLLRYYGASDRFHRSSRFMLLLTAADHDMSTILRQVIND